MSTKPGEVHVFELLRIGSGVQIQDGLTGVSRKARRGCGVCLVSVWRGPRRRYLYVVVAPNRFAARPFDDGQVRRAQGFVAEAFPGVFEPTPRTADESTTLFTVEGDDGYREHQLYVHRTGLIELLWALTYEDDGDALTIDPVEMASIVMQAAQAVARKTYTEVLRARRGWRRFARVDWWFQAATRISGPNGPRSWTNLRFPGQIPPRAHHDWAVAPPSGYGFQRLVNSRRRRAPEEIARVFLGEFLTANGYYELSEVVDEVIAHAASRLEGESETPAS